MASHLLNLLPSTSIDHDTPHFCLYNKHPSYSHLRTFGCLCYQHIQSPHKLAPHTTPCVFLGYPSQHRGFRCLDLHSRKIIISRLVVFHESIFPLESDLPCDNTTYQFLEIESDLDTSPLFHQLIHDPSSNIPTPNHRPTPSPPTNTTPTEPTHMAQSPPTTQIVPGPVHLPDPVPPPEPTQTVPDPTPTTEHTHPMTTRARSGISKPIQRLNLHTTAISPVPHSHLKALEDPNWTKAMNEEYSALVTNGM